MYLVQSCRNFGTLLLLLFGFHILLNLRNGDGLGFKRACIGHIVLAPLGHREPRKWTLQHYMALAGCQVPDPKCLLPFWFPKLPPRYVLTKHIPSLLLSYPIILLSRSRGKKGKVGRITQESCL